MVPEGPGARESVTVCVEEGQMLWERLMVSVGEVVGEAESVPVLLGQRVPVEQDEGVALVVALAVREGLRVMLRDTVAEREGALREGMGVFVLVGGTLPVLLTVALRLETREGVAPALPDPLPPAPLPVVVDAVAQRLARSVALREALPVTLRVRVTETEEVGLGEARGPVEDVEAAEGDRGAERLLPGLRVRVDARLPVALPQWLGERVLVLLGELVTVEQREARAEGEREGLGLPVALPEGERLVLRVCEPQLLGVAV